MISCKLRKPLVASTTRASSCPADVGMTWYVGEPFSRVWACEPCAIALQPHDEDQVVTLQFSWGGDLKPISTSFIGVSPEVRQRVYMCACAQSFSVKHCLRFHCKGASVRVTQFEMALYTMCFLSGAEDTSVVLGPYHVNIKCHRIGRGMIGTVYPEAEE